MSRWEYSRKRIAELEVLREDTLDALGHLTALAAKRKLTPKEEEAYRALDALALEVSMQIATQHAALRRRERQKAAR